MQHERSRRDDHALGHAPHASPGPGRQAARPGRGHRPAARSRRRPEPAPGIREPHPGRRPGGGQPANDHHLLAQGLHPADPAVPGPLRLLHVRDRAAPAAQPVPGARRGPRDRPPGRRTGLQGSPVHPGRPARTTLAPGERVAGRPRLRRHLVLRAGHGHPRPGGDRPAAAPQPGRAQLAGLPAPQAGRPLHGHDARDHGHPPVHRQERPALRQPGQGPGRPAARARGRRPLQRPVHHRHPDRHRRDPGRTRRLDLRHPQGRPRVPGHPGSHRAELPGQAGHQDARRARRRTRRPGRHHRRHPAAPRVQGPHPGPAQPGRRPARPDPAGRHRRLGRRLPAHPRPRQPRTPLARHRRTRRPHRGGRLHPARAPDHLPALPARALARPAPGRARGRAGRPGHRPGRRRRPAPRPALAGARRRPGRGRPHRPVRDHRHHRPHP